METTYYIRHEFQVVRELTGGSEPTDLFQVKDKLTNKYFVIKKLDKQYLDYENRLKKEYEYLTSLNSSNIVRGVYYSKSEKDNMPLFCMEYVEGEHIEEYLYKNPEKAPYIFSEVFRVLNYIHEKGIGHGDVKSNNFLIDSNDVLKIIDFGMATKLNTEEYTVLKSLENQKLKVNRTFNEELKEGKFTSKTDMQAALKMFKDISDKNSEIKFKLDKYVEKFKLIDNLQMCTYDRIKDIYDIESKEELTDGERRLFDLILNGMPVLRFDKNPVLKKVTFEEFSDFTDSILKSEIELVYFYRLFCKGVGMHYNPTIKVKASVFKDLKKILSQPKYMQALNDAVIDLLENVDVENDDEYDDLPF